MATPRYLSQNFSTTLNVPGGINSTQTTGIVLSSVTGLNTSGGYLCLAWANPLDTSVAEYIEYTGVSGNELTGVTRGAEGSTARAHSNGVTVAAVVSKNHVNLLSDKLRGVDTVAIEDTNGNEILKTSTTASAVNEVTITNAATGSAPTISATGSDTNIDLALSGKGTGKVKVNSSYGAITANTDGATVTFNMATSNDHSVTLGGNRTLAVSNVSTGQKFLVALTQDATGSRTVTWFSGISWAGGSAPTLTTTANKTDVFGFRCTGSGAYQGFVVGQNI